MGGKTLFWTLLVVLSSMFVYADSYSGLSADCSSLCVQEKWDEATKCFREQMDPPAAYLATAACAWNNNKDDIAEDYALKSASSKREWATFINKFGYTVMYTGGLGETYVLATVASGGARHKDKALAYLRTSRQCSKADDRDKCAEDYFNNVQAQYSARNLQSVRSSGQNPQKILKGRVTDHLGRPLKYAKMNFKCADGKDNLAYTDANGSYEISFVGVMDVSQVCTQGKLFLKMIYTDPKEDKVIFRMTLSDKETTVYKDVNIRTDADLKEDFTLTKPLNAAIYRSTFPLDQVADQAVMYYHMSEAVEFWKDVMKANIDYKLPVDVKSHQTAKPTCYSPTDSDIFIKLDDSPITSANRPMNREWHEFNHHVMYSQFWQWPGRFVTRNHNGYANPSTSDSYMEGFAEFWSGVIADHYKYANPHVYPIFGSMDLQWKVWDRRGFFEEVAVAAVLWDIYDRNADDQISLKKEDMWLILKTYSNDFNEVYQDFRRKYPDKGAQIDAIMLSHGFWKDNTTGDGTFEADEAFEDLNRNFVHNPGESYIDYPEDPVTGARRWTREPNEKIGPAANYHRQWRTNAVRLPTDDLLVDNNIPTYKVQVKFKDAPYYDYIYYSDNVEGRVNVVVPEEGAVVTVTPEGVSGAKPFVMTSEEYIENLEASIGQGYLTEHDFGVPDITLPAMSPPSNPGKSDAVPYWEYKENATVRDFEYQAPSEDPWSGDSFSFSPSSNRRMPWLPVLVIVIVIGGAIILFSRKKKKHKK